MTTPHGWDPDEWRDYKIERWIYLQDKAQYQADQREREDARREAEELRRELQAEGRTLPLYADQPRPGVQFGPDGRPIVPVNPVGVPAPVDGDVYNWSLHATTALGDVLRRAERGDDSAARQLAAEYRWWTTSHGSAQERSAWMLYWARADRQRP